MVRLGVRLICVLGTGGLDIQGEGDSWDFGTGAGFYGRCSSRLLLPKLFGSFGSLESYDT